MVGSVNLLDNAWDGLTLGSDQRRAFNFLNGLD
jgi:hypothetical protein